MRFKWPTEIPAGPVQTLEEVIDDPHLDAIGFFKHMKHPTEGDLVMPEPSVRFTDTPTAIDRLPPRLGEHAREILQEIGMTPDEIDALAASGGVVLPGAKEKVA